jgi:hypothetical protein
MCHSPFTERPLVFFLQGLTAVLSLSLLEDILLSSNACWMRARWPTLVLLMEWRGAEFESLCNVPWCSHHLVARPSILASLRTATLQRTRSPCNVPLNVSFSSFIISLYGVNGWHLILSGMKGVATYLWRLLLSRASTSKDFQDVSGLRRLCLYHSQYDIRTGTVHLMW